MKHALFFFGLLCIPLSVAVITDSLPSAPTHHITLQQYDEAVRSGKISELLANGATVVVHP